MADQYLKLIKARRTTYAIEAKSPVSDERIQQIASEVIKHTPSSFNSQSTRIVILLREEHVRFWDIAKECFQATLPYDDYQDYKLKLDGRQAGYGTILIFEDLDTVGQFQAKFPRYVTHFQAFSEHTSAMAAFNLWTAFHLEGFGCNLQHVNPTVDQRILPEWNIPATWALKAQLVFGTPTGGLAHEKTFKPLEERVLVPKIDRPSRTTNGNKAVTG